jgi:hypothetical protein
MAGMEPGTGDIEIYINIQYMMSEEEIVAKLKGIGFTDSEIPAVMQDVATVIYGKVLVAYLPTLPEEVRLQIISLRTEDAQDYFTDNASSLAQFPQAQFDSIYDETWRDYFKSVG